MIRELAGGSTQVYIDIYQSSNKFFLRLTTEVEPTLLQSLNQLLIN